MHGPDVTNANDSLRELGNALDRLQDALSRDISADSMFVDATIQRFEFSVELTWKTLKKLLTSEGEEARTPRQALQRAYAVGWIDDEKLWISMLTDRNLTSHTYKEALAYEIIDRIPGYFSAMRQLYMVLLAKYGEPV